MIYYIKLFVYFILINILFKSSYSISESECLGGLVTKYGFNFANVSGSYYICLTENQSCNSDGSVTTLTISNPNPSNTALLTVDEISCLPNLEQINLSNFALDGEFLTIKLPKASTLQVSKSTFTNSTISSELAPYDNLNIFDTDQFDGIDLDLSYIKGVNRFMLYNEVRLVEPKDINSITSSLSLSFINLVDFTKFTNLNSVNFELSDGFDKNTIQLASTLKTSTLIQISSYTSTSQIPISIFSVQFNTPRLVLNGQFETPTSAIDLSSFNSSVDLSIMNPSANFNINGSHPFKSTGDVNLEFYSSNYSSFQPISKYIPLKALSFNTANFYENSNLGSYQGSFQYVNLYSSGIIGTIDSSWCSTNLLVYGNQLTGTIPSCFKCYFEDLEYDKRFSALIPMKGRFNGNSFTNYDSIEACTTFAPKPQIISSSSLLITGTDIGFKPYNFFIEGYLECAYTINELGKSYTCSYINGFLDGKSYYSIRFLYPGNRTLTFAVNQSTPPSITSVDIIGNSFTINGQFFSSYNGYVGQSVKVQNSECSIVGDSSDFFKISCSLSAIPSAEKFLLEVNANSLVSKVLLSKSQTNDKQCPNGCKNGVCDLSSGQCLCQVNQVYQECNTHTISSIDPSNENGGEAIFYGSFKDQHIGLSITIGDQACTPIILNTSTIIKCIAPPGKGIKNVTMIQNDLIYIGKNLYKYKELSIECPKNCTNSNQGICDTSTGLCNCINGYQNYDCSEKQGGNNGGGGGDTTIDTGTGSTNITNGQTRFQIYFNALNEVDIDGNLINSYTLKDNWIVNSTDSSLYTFKQQLNGTNCTVSSTIEEITNENGKIFTFADTTFKLPKDSIKFTISIENYPYSASLNTLSLEFVSSVDQLTSESTCNSKDTEMDTSYVNDKSTFNYIKISKNNQILTGRFINKLVSDSRSTFYSTTIKNTLSTNSSTSTNSSIILSLNLPHCSEKCLIDPDFSLIVSSDFKNKCNSSSRKWLIPVAVVVPVVGLACIIIVLSIIYKKNTKVKVLLKGIKLSKL